MSLLLLIANSKRLYGSLLRSLVVGVEREFFLVGPAVDVVACIHVCVYITVEIIAQGVAVDNHPRAVACLQGQPRSCLAQVDKTKLNTVVQATIFNTFISKGGNSMYHNRRS